MRAMENPIAGIFPIEIGGKEYRLQYTWSAMAQITKKFGADANLYDYEILPHVIAFGMQKHHPDEANPEFVLEHSPPIAPCIDAVTKGIKYAYFGPEEPPADAEENPQTARKTRQKTSSAPSKPVTELESTLMSSGV